MCILKMFVYDLCTNIVVVIPIQVSCSSELEYGKQCVRFLNADQSDIFFFDVHISFEFASHKFMDDGAYVLRFQSLSTYLCKAISLPASRQFS